MIYLLWIILVVQTSQPGWAFYHELSMVTFTPPNPLPKDSYFGYSIAYQPILKQIIVSAPAADDVGVIFACAIDTRACVAQKSPIKNRVAEVEHKFWLGATVRSSDDYFMTCAPRYSLVYNGTYGGCYRFQYATAPNSWESIAHLTPADRKLNNPKHEHKMDSLGWSIEIAADKTFAVGGPAMRRGRVTMYKDFRSYPKLIQGEENLGDLTILFNFGYSIAAGNYISRNRNSVLYAVSSPYGEIGEGKILFFEFNKDVAQKLPSMTLLSKGVGMLYGAVLCSANFRSTASLIVGAPTYATDDETRYDIGAVYIYDAEKPIKLLRNENRMALSRTIVGTKKGGYFGSAIANVGDLDGDQIDDIVIAAPYEDDGRGAVYLYLGSAILAAEHVRWAQRIQPEGFRAFGLSVTSLKDYDENGCNELAIGAPFSDSLVLLRCMATISINITTEFPNLQKVSVTYPPEEKYLSRNEISFSFKACICVDYPEKPITVKAKVLMNVEITHSQATLDPSAGNGIYEIELDNKLATNKPERKTSCRRVAVLTPPNGNYDQPIRYNISAKLLNSPIESKIFDESRVVLSNRSTLETEGLVWANQCKNENQCIPVLSLDSTHSIKTPYLIGSTDLEVLSFRINNTGEVAYGAWAMVRFDNSIRVVKAPADCVIKEEEHIKCTPHAILTQNSFWDSGDITLDMTNLKSSDKTISMHIDLYDHFDTSEFKTYYITVPAIIDTKHIIIRGSADVGSIVYMNEKDITTTGKHMEHVYTIMNNGPTNWEKLTCQIELEKTKYTMPVYNDSYAAMYTENNNPIPCQYSTENKDYFVTECKIANLPKYKSVKIIFPIFIKPGELVEIIKNDKNNVLSNINLEVDGVKKSLSIVTSVRDLLESTPLWVIIVAAIVGILILVIIAMILHECGCLRRKNKEKLRDLRKSVRRQTMRRSQLSEAARNSRSSAQRSSQEHQRLLQELGDARKNRVEGITNDADLEFYEENLNN